MSKEKQIEEMAKIIVSNSYLCKDEYLRTTGKHNRDNCEKCDLVNCCIPHRQATDLYNAGYRKQSEGEWQIKSEIYKLFDDVDEELYVECPFCKRRFPVPYELDDEKIFKYAREHYPYCNCGAKMKGGVGNEQ